MIFITMDDSNVNFFIFQFVQLSITFLIFYPGIKCHLEYIYNGILI